MYQLELQLHKRKSIVNCRLISKILLLGLKFHLLGLNVLIELCFALFHVSYYVYMIIKQCSISIYVTAYTTQTFCARHRITYSVNTTSQNTVQLFSNVGNLYISAVVGFPSVTQSTRNYIEQLIIISLFKHLLQIVQVTSDQITVGVNSSLWFVSKKACTRLARTTAF